MVFAEGGKPKKKRTASVLVAAALLLGCMTGFSTASPRGKKKKDKQNPVAQEPAKPVIDPSTLVWPPPPDVARIKWQTEVSGEDDLKSKAEPQKKKKKKMSWMDRLAGITLPEDREQKGLTLGKPYGVSVDSKGRIYVADSGQALVFVFDLENRTVQAIGGKANLNFAMPLGIAVDDADRIFVTDARLHRVTVLSPERQVEQIFGQEKLERPVGVAIDGENRFLYVVDAKASRVAVFDADKYTFLRYVGKPSDPLDPEPGTLSTPLDIAVDEDGNVFVTDTLNDRVQMFDADGNFVSMFGKQGVTPGTFMRAKGIAVDPDGHVYITDAEFSNVQVFDREGHILAAFGSRGNNPGQFGLVTGITIDKMNRIIVADQWRSRIQVFRYVTDAEAEKEKAAGKPAQASANTQ